MWLRFHATSPLDFYVTSVKCTKFAMQFERDKRECGSMGGQARRQCACCRLVREVGRAPLPVVALGTVGAAMHCGPLPSCSCMQ